MIGRMIGGIAATCTAGALMSDQVRAESLIAAYVNPPSHVYVTHGMRPWMECVTQATNGELTFQDFPSGQIVGAGDAIHALQSGVAHVAGVVTSYESDKVPLNNIPTLPGVAENAVQVTAAFRASMENGSPLAEEWKALGIQPIIGMFSAPYQLMSTTPPVDTMDKLKGLKVRAAAGAASIAMDAVGATPIEMPTADLYVAMQRGTVDATVLHMSAAPAYKLDELVKSISTNGSFSFSETAWVINKDVFDGLSEPHQKAVMDCGLEIEKTLAAHLDADAQRVVDEFKAKGIEFYAFPPEMLEPLNAGLGTVAGTFVNELNARGFPGKDAYEGFLKAVAEAK